jgi:DNA replication protein DnaC
MRKIRKGGSSSTAAQASAKTHLAAGIGIACQDKGKPVMFVVVPDLLDHLRATFSPTSTVSYDRMFNEVLTSEMLILDDLGTQSATPWAREKLYQILNYRYNAELPTVITTRIRSTRWMPASAAA